MGMLYEFRCPECEARRSRPERAGGDEPTLHIPPMGEALGCGLGYPYVCKSIYGKIREGEYGPEARKAMRWMIRPGIYHSRDVHVCEKCGNWTIGDTVKICRLKIGQTDQGSPLDKRREAQAGPMLRPICWLDETKWDVVWENTHACSRCGERMIPRREPKNLKCRTCGGQIEVSIVGHWD